MSKDGNENNDYSEKMKKTKTKRMDGIRRRMLIRMRRLFWQKASKRRLPLLECLQCKSSGYERAPRARNLQLPETMPPREGWLSQLRRKVAITPQWRLTCTSTQFRAANMRILRIDTSISSRKTLVENYDCNGTSRRGLFPLHPLRMLHRPFQPKPECLLDVAAHCLRDCASAAHIAHVWFTRMHAGHRMGDSYTRSIARQFQLFTNMGNTYALLQLMTIKTYNICIVCNGDALIRCDDKDAILTDCEHYNLKPMTHTHTV